MIWSFGPIIFFLAKITLKPETVSIALFFMTFAFFQNCSFTVTFTYFVHTFHSVLQILMCRKPYTWPVVTRFQIYQNYVDRKTIDGFKEHEILVKYALRAVHKRRQNFWGHF